MAARHTRPRLAFAVLIFVFAASYRFNTLGGALGGFDNDHFVYFAYAKQVEAGERPLRDFSAYALQGAWPSLTYAFSAAAQRWLGDTFRSEALLTVVALSAAASVTWFAASAVAPAGWAAGATVLSVLIAPKLYNYPKVLLLAVGALLVIRYARRPSAYRAAALGVLTAVAFLFRHDYAVYVGLGAVTVLFAAGQLSRLRTHGLAYAGVTVLLLAPSLAYIQGYDGLVTYADDALNISQREFQRTDLPWQSFTRRDEDGREVSPAALLTVPHNAVTLLYYLHLVVPVAMFVVLWRTREAREPDGVRAAIVAITLMMLVTLPLILRGNLGGRFGDMAPVTAVVYAALVTRALRRWRHEGAPFHLARAAVVLVVTVAGVVAVWTVGSVHQELDTSGWSDSPEKLVRQAGRRWQELAMLPAAYWTETTATGSVAAAKYLNHCTRPTDRLVILAYAPELLTLADRRFGAGRAAVMPEILASDRQERFALARWQAQRVPLVLTVDEENYRTDYPAEYPLIDAYLQSAYELAGTLQVDGNQTLRVLRHRAIEPVGVFGETSLPCFR